MSGFGGKVAIVTGGGSGLGEAIGKALAAKGAKVVLSDIRREAADRVAAEVAEAGGTASAFIGINLSGVLYGMRYQIPAMLQTGARESAIVNMASIRGTVAAIGNGAYTAPKSSRRTFRSKPYHLQGGSHADDR